MSAGATGSAVNVVWP